MSKGRSKKLVYAIRDISRQLRVSRKADRGDDRRETHALAAKLKKLEAELAALSESSELRGAMEALTESTPTVLGEVARLEKELARFKKLAAGGASLKELKKRLNHVRANLENIGMVIHHEMMNKR
jgi:uncharacterized coiled-coil DUF342 family protein